MCCMVFIKTAGNAQTKNGTEMKHPSTEIIRYTIPSEKHSEFEKAYATAAGYLKQSAYCLNYQILHGDEEPNNYMVIITWKSKEDHLNGFRNSEEFRSFFNLVRPYYNNIQEMKHYMISEVRWTRPE